MWSYKTSLAFVQHHLIRYGGLITLQGLISAARVESSGTRDPVSTSVWIIHVARFFFFVSFLLSLREHPFLKPPPCDLPPPTHTFPSDSRYESATLRPPWAEKLQAESHYYYCQCCYFILWVFFLQKTAAAFHSSAGCLKTRWRSWRRSSPSRPPSCPSSGSSWRRRMSERRELRGASGSLRTRWFNKKQNKTQHCRVEVSCHRHLFLFSERLGSNRISAPEGWAHMLNLGDVV